MAIKASPDNEEIRTDGRFFSTNEFLLGNYTNEGEEVGEGDDYYSRWRLDNWGESFKSFYYNLFNSDDGEESDEEESDEEEDETKFVESKITKKYEKITKKEDNLSGLFEKKE